LTKKKSYQDWTYNSKNPLRRFAHRTRHRYSVDAISISVGERILDFGCGDGLFLNNLAQNNNLDAVQTRGFEPYMKSLSDNEIVIKKSWSEIEKDVSENGLFDYVTSYEVFEHFNPERQAEALARIGKVIKPDGQLIISVPIEKGFPALVKTAIRRVNHPHNKHLYNVKNAVSSLIGSPLPDYREGDAYLSHLGFYFTDLEKLFESNWVIENRFFSPFKSLPYHLNSQVFYFLKNRK